jgi:hypothetical protein
VAAGTATITATSEGKSTTSTITVTLVPVASVAVTPAATTITAGSSQQLSAVTLDAAGNTLTGRVVTWVSSNTLIATVSGGGIVTGQATGSATITATSESKTAASAITVTPMTGTHVGHYVAQSGSPNGDGTAARPWDLQTALNQPAAVHPGDTIWLRGGTYGGQFTSTLNGTPTSPVIVRQYPGERATLDAGAGTALTVFGSYTSFQGFEVTSSAPLSSRFGFNNSGAGIKFINLVIHDTRTGIGNFTGNNPRQPEIYGSLIYNNGQTSSDHGIYLENNGSTGTAFITDNVVFNNWGFGIHMYGQASNEFLSGIDVEGNAAFGTTSIAIPSQQYNDILIGGAGPTVASNITISNNYTYRTGAPSFDPNSAGIELGYTAGVQNGDIVAQNNYIVGGMHMGMWSSAQLSGNTIYDYAGPMVQNQGSLSRQTWTANTFYGDPALARWVYGGSSATDFTTWTSQTGLVNAGSYGGGAPPNFTVVRPNRYEAGRGNIIVYNWANLPAVDVDLSGVLSRGQSFNIFNVQDFFGAPVVSGIYGGGTVRIPMVGIPAPTPIGRGTVPSTTGPTFQVFVVRLTGA